MFKFLNSKPFKLIITMIISYFLGRYGPYQLNSFLYSISLSIKEILLLFLPAIIFFCLCFSLGDIPKNQLWKISILILIIIASNFFTSLIGYFLGHNANTYGLIGTFVNDIQSLELKPLFSFKIDRFIKNEHALFLGTLFGITLALTENAKLKNFAYLGHMFSMRFLRNCFIPVLPLFISGFLIKLIYEGKLVHILMSNYKSITLMVLSLYIYIFFIYLVGARFNLPRAFNYLQNALLPAITGFSVMSSAAALPLSINAAATNTKNHKVAEIVMPFTVNIHLIGNSFCVPIMIFILMKGFNMPVPSLSVFLIFAIYFALYKFAVAAVMGGGIIVTMPLLEKYLGFSSEMSTLILTFYLLLDPFITAANVLGNNGLVILVQRLFKHENPRH